jgi:hypothetical protein
MIIILQNILKRKDYKKIDELKKIIFIEDLF